MRQGLIDLSGEFVIDPVFDVVRPSLAAGGPTLVRSGGKRFYVGHDGQPLFDCRFGEAGVFSDGLASVEVDGRTGYLDASGEFRIPPRFEYGSVFRDGQAIVKVDGLFGFVDLDGEWLIPPRYSHLEAFSCGLTAARPTEGDGMGFLDPAGTWAVEPIYDQVRNFEEGLGWVQEHPPVGYLDDFTRVGFTGFLDTDGNRVFELPAGVWKGYGFSEGLCNVITRSAWPRCGYVDTKGELVIPLRFASATGFDGGHAAVEVPVKDSPQGRWGFIDRDGEYTVPPIYDDANPFSNGVAVVKEKDRYRYVRPDGTTAFSGTFAGAYSFRHGVAKVCTTRD